MANPTSYIVTTSKDPLRVWVSPGSSTILGLLSKGLVVSATGNITKASNGLTYAEIIMPNVGSTVDGRAGWAAAEYLADASSQADIADKQATADAAQAAGVPDAPPPNSTVQARDITQYSSSATVQMPADTITATPSPKVPSAMIPAANEPSRSMWPYLLLGAVVIGAVYYYVDKKGGRSGGGGTRALGEGRSLRLGSPQPFRLSGESMRLLGA